MILARKVVSSSVHSMHAGRDGRFLVTCSASEVAVRWLHSLELYHMVEAAPPAAICCGAMTLDERFVVIGMSDGAVGMYSVSIGRDEGRREAVRGWGSRKQRLERTLSL